MDDAEARAILREHGEEPPKRGQLGASWRERAEQLTMHGNGAEPAADLLADDYDQGVTAADFVSAADEPPAAAAEQLEQRPRKPKRPPRRPLLERVRAAGSSGSSGKGKPKKHHPRVRVDGLISRGWAVLGAAAMRIDAPVGRCITMQAPVAGLVLEDAVKGTFIDRGLQPIARVEERAEKVASVVLPPVLVAALEIAQQLPEPQRKAREALILPLLIESLVLGERVAGQYSEEAIARAAADEPARERAANLVAAIFAVPTEAAATSDDTAAA